MSADRIFKLGMLALQMRLVSPEQVLAALGEASLAELERLAGPETDGYTPELTLRTIPPMATPAAGHDAPSRYLPLRLHAAGGLGEVHVALDAELGREVALKRIQDQFADHPDARRRFLREAEVTGRLEHPGVVPIYGLCAPPGGRPCYAMRFVRGEGLDAAIARFHAADAAPRDHGERELALRGLLGRFAAVCNAVAFAHGKGVIHRDLKPANVMLGEFGETLVVDWGLAKVMRNAERGMQQEEKRSDNLHSGNTRQGQAMGTPAFQPPEQARGEEVGVRTDVWALGATLFAIVTGRPPYVGQQVSRQAEEGCPSPPRRVNGRVPKALEAVCLKAMARDPGDRYDGALALAADVERFLADEPVLAYREPFAARCRRWGRRHRAAVTSAALLLLLSFLAMGVGLLAVRREQNRTAEALAKSEENFALAKRAVDESLEVARTSRQLERPYALQVRRELLSKAARFYEEFKGRAPAEEADHLFRVGGVHTLLGNHDKAEAALRQAKKLDEQLLSSLPHEAEYLSRSALTSHNLAELFVRQGKSAEARAHYEEARRILTRLAEAHPAQGRHTNDLTRTLLGLGGVCPPEEARSVYREAIARQTRLLRDPSRPPLYQRYLGTAWNNLGAMLLHEGDLAGARAAYENARDVQQVVAESYKADLARTHSQLGVLSLAGGQASEAAAEFERAVALQREAVAAEPDVRGHRHALASYCKNVAVARLQQGIRSEARAAFEEALASLVEESAETVEDRRRAAAYHLYLSDITRDLGDRDAAARHAASAARTWQRLIDRGEGDATARDLVRNAYRAAAEGLARGGRHREAATAWSQAAVAASRFVESPLPVRERQAEDCAARAVHQLRRAAECGQFDDAGARLRLDADPALAPLRDRADYRQFRAGLPR